MKPEPDGGLGLRTSAFCGGHADEHSGHVLKRGVRNLSVAYTLVAHARHCNLLAGSNRHVEVAVENQSVDLDPLARLPFQRLPVTIDEAIGRRNGGGPVLVWDGTGRIV